MASSKRVLVTGANGHLGAHVVRSLLKRGHAVAAMVRQGADMRGLAGLDVERRYGDIMDRASLVTACDGCQAVVHTAAVYRVWAKNDAEVLQPALVGTRNIFAAAREAGVERLVYTSSIAAVGYSPDPGQLRNESHWHDDARNVYFVSKLQSEREALRLSQELDLPTIRICPASAYGPYDFRITPSMRRLLNTIHTGEVFQGGESVVDIRDVAEVHAAAVEHGQPGGRYVYGGANLTQHDLAALVSRFTGTKLKRLPGSRRVALLAGQLTELSARLAGKPPRYTASIIHESAGRWGFLDSSLAIGTFGVVPRPAEETIRDGIRWLLHIGAVTTPIPAHLLEVLAPDPEWAPAT
jgi:dihydroflavonol-4-reductase